MSIRSSLEYLAGVDHFAAYQKSENEKLEAATGKEHNLPFDAGLETGLEVMKDRIETVITYPVVLLGRLTGVDAARRMIAHRRNG